MAQSGVHPDVFDPTDIDEDVRKSLAAIRRQRSQKLTLALFALVAILFTGAVFVYLAYSSEPGTMKPVPHYQP